MRFRKLTMLLVLSACVPVAGCAETELFQQESEQDTADHADQRFDLNGMKQQVLRFQQSWNDAAQTPVLQEQIDTVIQAVDEAYAQHCRAQIAYYADWNNDDLFALNHVCTEDYFAAADIADWFFANGYKKSADSALFAPYIEEENLPYYTGNSLTRIIAYAKSDASADSERLNDYYNLAYGDEPDLDKTNKRCAKIYLDSLKELDVSQALFNYYDRDYTAAEASEVYQEIRAQLVPLRDALERRPNDSGEDIWSEPLHDDPYDLLKQYAPKLSPSIAESADKLFSEHLYTAAEGLNCYDGSFTLNLPNEQIGLMYTYLTDTAYDFITVTHEFGHFHSDWRDTTPVCMQGMNLDIAEAQSQSMVTLFLPYYQEIFGADAVEKQQLVLLDLLDAAISGYAVGEFKYRVTQHLDDFSPSDTAKLFADIMDECGVNLELYEVSHLFEQPGYYISYGVSALPALEMYTVVMQDPEQAHTVYDELSGYSCLSGEYAFRDVMQRCGFSDYFDAASICQLAETLRELIDTEI